MIPAIVSGEFACLFSFLFTYVGLLDWELPLIERIFCRIDTTVILRALAVAVDGEMPLNAALETLARSYLKQSIRRRLAHALQGVDEGVDWCKRLETEGLIGATERAVLESAQRVGNLPWALREMAESGERRFGYRLQAWTLALWPVAMIGIGALIFMVAVAYFAPLITLITEFRFTGR